MTQREELSSSIIKYYLQAELEETIKTLAVRSEGLRSSSSSIWKRGITIQRRVTSGGVQYFGEYVL